MSLTLDPKTTDDDLIQKLEDGLSEVYKTGVDYLEWARGNNPTFDKSRVVE